ncbi:hypothetical protein, partial [Microbacterium marinilacus]|uniref:hypothetical protein n=1 Tax=Microbacterium marinilacus TaxID=415209 RepID=UPI001C8D0DA9
LLCSGSASASIRNARSRISGSNFFGIVIPSWIRGRNESQADSLVEHADYLRCPTPVRSSQVGYGFELARLATVQLRILREASPTPANPHLLNPHAVRSGRD